MQCICNDTAWKSCRSGMGVPPLGLSHLNTENDLGDYFCSFLRMTQNILDA